MHNVAGHRPVVGNIVGAFCHKL